MQSGDLHCSQTPQKQCKSAASGWVLSVFAQACERPLAGIPTQNGECTCSEALLGMRPAARVSLPMWMIPRRKVPVVMTTLLQSTRSPAAIRHHSLKRLQGQPCIGCTVLACCSEAAALVQIVTVKKHLISRLVLPSTHALYANTNSPPQPLKTGATAHRLAPELRPA